MVSKIEQANGDWYAEEQEDGSFNIYQKQEDYTYGLLSDGQRLEDVLNSLGDSEATWTDGKNTLHISRPNGK